MKKQEIDRKQLVVKHNDLIQKARFNLTVTQQKLIAYLISLIKPTDEDFKTYCISVRDFCALTGSEIRRCYKDLQDIIDDIDNKCFWFADSNGKTRKFRWFAETAYVEGKGKIEIILAPTLKEYLLHLQSHFTAYQIYNILALKSKYAIRMFELFKSYQFVNEKEIEINELKQLLYAENYKTFKDFKERVLDRAIEEINIYTILDVSYTKVRKGNKIAALNFKIREKTDQRQQIAQMNTIRELNKRNKQTIGQLCLDDIELMGTLTKNNKPIRIYKQDEQEDN